MKGPLPVAIAACAALALALACTRPVADRRKEDAELATSPDSVAPAVSPFLPTIENKAMPPGAAPEGMAWIPGGEFSMGSDVAGESLCALPGVTRDAQPVHRVYVDGFWMDRTEVTNAQFQAFVRATH